MRNLVAFATVATALSFSAVTAQAGGWGSSGWGNNGNSNTSAGGLVNVSPSIQTGNIGVLNGIKILNGSPIASGNVVSGILSGNGVLSGNNTGVGVLGLGSGLLNNGKRR